MSNNKIALITGATSGIGKATAKQLAALSYNLVLTGRRDNLLTELKLELENAHNVQVKTLCFDIREQQSVALHFASLPTDWQTIDLLVNNAGLAIGFDPFQKGVLADWELMIDTNIKGVLYITREVLPNMMKANRGHIINLGSIAGHEAYLNGNVYCATKAAINYFSKGLRMDLVGYNIKVSEIAPGMVDTEFSTVRFKGDKTRAENTYKGLTPLYAEDIADAIVYIATRPPHVSINEMLINPTAQASATVVNRKIE